MVMVGPSGSRAVTAMELQPLVDSSSAATVVMPSAQVDLTAYPLQGSSSLAVLAHAASSGFWYLFLCFATALEALRAHLHQSGLRCPLQPSQAWLLTALDQR